MSVTVVSVHVNVDVSMQWEWGCAPCRFFISSFLPFARGRDVSRIHSSDGHRECDVYSLRCTVVTWAWFGVAKVTMHVYGVMLLPRIPDWHFVSASHEIRKGEGSEFVH